jgi:chorismate--pyruvate lyase
MKDARGPAPTGRVTTRCPLGSSAHRAALHDWLTHAASLTARIRARSRHFEVCVLYQGPAALHPVEHRLLGGTGVAHVREVLLMADGVPVVWARTVLRASALRGPWHFLGRLGTRPLGERLFTDPAISRTRFAFLPTGQLHAGRVPPKAPLAARRALLLRGGQVAVLTEALLPAVLALCREPAAK